MGAFRLWPQEYEPLREEAQAAMRAFVEQAAKAMAPATASLAERVQRQRDMMTAREADHGGSPREIAGVPCRLILPAGPTRGIYLHFHGGGFVAGSALAYEAANARLSQALGLAVLSVDYRLAPEHPYPAAIEDGMAVLDWLLAEGAAELGVERIVVGGDSAGACITAALMLRLRDRGEDLRRIRGINLVYGGYDMSRGTPAAHGRRASTIPDVLTPTASAIITDSLLPGMGEAERRDPAVSPVFADLAGLPPALLTVGSADHLLDINILFAGRLAAAGNEVDLAVYPDCSHGFLRFPIELARRATARIDDFFAQALAR